LYLGAIGYGLGSMVEEIEGRSYLQFFFPALMVASGMIVSYFESTYSSYAKFTRQRSFQTMLLTPLGTHDILTAEIFWATFKGWLSSFGILLICFSMGLLSASMLLPLIVFTLLNAWVFSSLGLLISSYAKS